MSVTVDSLFEPTSKFFHHFVRCQSFRQLVRFMSHMVGSLNHHQDEMNAIHKVELAHLHLEKRWFIHMYKAHALPIALRLEDNGK